MPEKKNQHFVPRVHFRPFSHDGRSVGLLLKSTGKIIDRASIGDQCSKSYFYGRDLVTENLLAPIERRYGEIVADWHDRQDVDPDAMDYMRYVVWIQHNRVASVLNEARASMLATKRVLEEQLGRELGEIDLDHETLLRERQAFTAQERRLVADLQLTILDNRSSCDFVTSDNPAIAINKWFAQRFPQASWGYRQSGLIMLMPLSPRMAFLAYDSQVYKVPSRSSRLMVRRDEDVRLCNALIAAHADNAIYFRHDSGGDAALACLADLAEFHVREQQDTAESVRGMSRTYAVRVRPNRWPSFIEAKFRPVAYATSDGRSFVRNPFWAAAPRVHEFESDSW